MDLSVVYTHLQLGLGRVYWIISHLELGGELSVLVVCLGRELVWYLYLGSGSVGDFCSNLVLPTSRETADCHVTRQ